MMIRLHKNATTTPATRAYIQSSPLSVAALSAELGVSEDTIRRWKRRDFVEDRPHTAHRLQTTLTPAQERVVVELRKTLQLPLDDLLVVTREFINPWATRSGLYRLLKRHGLSQLPSEAKDEPCASPRVSGAEAMDGRGAGGQDEPASKPFKNYMPGYLLIDVKYLPQMPDEHQRGTSKNLLRGRIASSLPRSPLAYLLDMSRGFAAGLLALRPLVTVFRGAQRRYLFIAIDRATRWLFIQIKPNKTGAAARSFLKALHKTCPVRITHILTDNGKEFTDRLFASSARAPSGKHEFDQLCQALGIKHRLTKPRHPQTNGMVEHFNGRIAEVLATHHFNSAEDLETTLNRYVWLYNHHLPQKALGHMTPLKAMKKWYAQRPDLFIFKPRNRPGPDTRNRPKFDEVSSPRDSLVRFSRETPRKGFFVDSRSMA